MFLYPTTSKKSVYDLNFKALYHKGYRGIIFDIDNTLVEHGAPADDRCIRFFGEIHAIGFRTMIVSNNKEPRVKSFADAVKSPYLYKAGKPSQTGYLTAMERMGTDCGNTLCIGDQLFTDILGANLCGMDSVLVGRVAGHEEIQIYLKRILELPFLIAFVEGKKRKFPKKSDT